MIRLTDSEKAVLKFVNRYMVVNNDCPSNKQIGGEVGLSSVYVYKILQKLAQAGFIEYDGSRDIEVLWLP